MLLNNAAVVTLLCAHRKLTFCICIFVLVDHAILGPALLSENMNYYQKPTVNFLSS
jgi:hypothetical protein